MSPFDRKRTRRANPPVSIFEYREPAIEMAVSKSRGKMPTKPILFWPKPWSDIERHLEREADDFSVVNTNYAYELQKLYKLRRETAIFDPFPHNGEHYQDFHDHVAASDCRCHIVGLEACQEVLRALKDPSLAHSSTEELCAALNVPCSTPAASSSRAGVKGGNPLMLFSRPSIIKRGMRLPIDWSYLNWANTSLSAILVFVAALIGHVLSRNNSLIAAIVATLLFAALYVCVRANFPALFSSMAKRLYGAAKNQSYGLKRSWLKK